MQLDIESVISRIDELDTKTDLIIEMLREIQKDLQDQKHPLNVMEGHVHNVEHCMQSNLMVRNFRFLWQGWQYSFPMNLTNGMSRNAIRFNF